MELENTDIIGIVRGMGLTPDQLAAIVKAAAVPAALERKEDGDETV